MIELLEQMNMWHWLAFGLGLLLLELLGTAGYLLWVGLSAMIVGVCLSLLPISWQLQWIAFASFSLVATWLWWRYQFNKDQQDDESSLLNKRDLQMIGKTARLEDAVQQGKCRIKIGDTTWTAETERDLEANTLVKVVKVTGIVLTIEPV
ncbi:MAG: NfeD family protein [Aliivibrio sp.]|uniref:NfeD family protein n=1 Tax=Aliivibrio sp. TaxID=1872443 RepID=UPI001A420DCD|nr:NfeD family protein [Aliivibrio sp.]